jgi:SEC-C motif-containing protein
MTILCPCQSQLTYNECCEPFLTRVALPATPEALMRSRYTAYSQAKIDYISETMRGKALINFSPKDAAQWAKEVQWLGLQIIKAEPAVSNKGYVEFVARYSQGNQEQQLHEISEFEYDQGRWYYVDGTYSKT